MAKEALAYIREAEEESARLVEKAQAESARIVADANNKAEQDIEAATEKARIGMETARKEAAQKAGQDRQAFEAETQTMCAELDHRLQGNKANAIQAVMRAIAGN